MIPEVGISFQWLGHSGGASSACGQGCFCSGKSLDMHWIRENLRLMWLPNLQYAFRDSAKAWAIYPELYLLGAVALMTLSGMAQPSSGPPKAVFWLVCVPTVVWILVQHHGGRRLWHNVSMRWGLGILLLYVVSIAWSVATTADRRVDTAIQSVETAFFVIALYFAFQSDVYSKIVFAKALVVACVIGALISLVGFYSDHALTARLNSRLVYLLGYPTKAPVVMLGCLVTAVLLLNKDESRTRTVWLLIGFLTVGVFCFMTQTRGALISFACLAMLSGAYYLGAKRTVVAIIALVIVAAIFVTLVPLLEHAWASRIATGLDARIVIWTHVVQAFMDAPWLGHGGAAIFENSLTSDAIATELGHNIAHPHSLFFSALYYFGLVGFVVVVGFLLSIVAQLWRCQNRQKWLGFAALLCLLLMTASNTHILIAEVSKEWWVWWLPTIAIATFVSSDQEVPKD